MFGFGYNTKAETLERLRRIEQLDKEMEQMKRLYAPLVRVLLPMRYEWQKAGVPVRDKTITLSTVAWPEQFKKGVDRVLGFNINWVYWV
ncbi:hypothetical protein LCGC14_2931170 [marine sediment metagenome]|uniref:Uncharacterized protein n=1 Tax=marine sediment metagenome TaxID=412755 RepID=A0A0F8ZTJ3_9ZZZZ